MEKLMAHIEDCFYKPDLQAARIIYGTAFAHYIPDTNPIWMFVVGAPSSGKTAITITALQGLQGMFGEGNLWGARDGGGGDDGDVMVAASAVKKNKHCKPNEAVEVLSTINPNTFLSHQIGGKKGADDPGLLEQINDGAALLEKGGRRKIVSGNLLCLIPDFTVMASMRREVRGEIMGQLRRIYDGQFEKKIGTRQTKIWNGKMSMLAATTPVIDKYTSIDSALGERFIQLNWRSSRDVGRGAFTVEMMMRKAQGFKVKGPLQKLTQQLFFEHDPTLILLKKGDPVIDRLAALAELIAEGRSSVFGHFEDKKFQVTETSVAEDVHRVIQQFIVQMSGLCTIQGRTYPIEQDIQDILRVGIETLPTYRSIVLQAAIQGRPLGDYAGKDHDKRAEAVKLEALGVIQRVVGPGVVKLRSEWQACVERIGFEFDTVFVHDGAAGARERDLEQAVLQAPKEVF
jgi:hypothetical protein